MAHGRSGNGTDNGARSRGDGSGGEPTFRVSAFEGPLDLLLYLIRKAEVSIYDIPIATITEQYLAYLEQRLFVDLENATEFYLMAATLLQIKSRMLLPVDVDGDDDVDDPRAELVEHLIEYQRFKRFAELLSEHASEARWLVKRVDPLPHLDDAEETADTLDEMSPWDLLVSYRQLIDAIGSPEIFDIAEEVTVNEKITLAHEMLESREEFPFEDLVAGGSSLSLICSFLAVLELARSRIVSLLQQDAFTRLDIRKRKAIAAAEMEDS